MILLVKFKMCSFPDATCYQLVCPDIESRWGARFCPPVQTGPGAHAASSTVGIQSFPDLKRPGRSVNHLPQSSSAVKEFVVLFHSHHHPVPSCPFMLPFTLNLFWQFNKWTPVHLNCCVSYFFPVCFRITWQCCLLYYHKAPSDSIEGTHLGRVQCEIFIMYVCHLWLGL